MHNRARTSRGELRKVLDSSDRKRRRLRCAVCAKVLRAFKVPIDRSVIYNIGTVEEVLFDTKCSAHTEFLWKFLPSNWSARGVLNLEVTKYQGEPFVTLGCHWWGYPFSGPRSSSLVLLKRKSGLSYVGHGALLNPRWIDQADLLRWKNAIDKSSVNGSPISSTIGHLKHVRPQWLVDTELKRLVHAEPDMEYVALSYVWGQRPFFRTVKGNLKKLQSDGALSRIRGDLQIPPTISNAIALAGILGERYLWVDSLCIVQDGENCHIHFNMMGGIFSNARLTIIAEDGSDAFHGLRGLRGISEPRCYNQRICELGKGHQIMECRRPRIDGTSVWSQRGWTFQENLFSHSRIIFSAGTVRCEWEDGVWFEGVDHPEPYSERIPLAEKQLRSKHRALFRRRFPDLAGYNELVSDYNVTQLTFAQDALPAFAGITSSLSRVFKGGFLCGLPVMFFDVALLWTPQDELKRRVALDAATECCLPSWSWAGWQGKINPRSWLSGCDYARIGMDIPSGHTVDGYHRVKPLVRWYCHGMGNSKKKMVESTCLTIREEYLGQDKEVPPGWIRHDLYPLGTSSCDGSLAPRYFYEHVSLPFNNFWYPIPLCTEDDPEDRPGPESMWPLLSCETKRAWFRLSEKIPHHPLCFSLRDRDGTWSGIIQSQQDPLCGPVALSKEDPGEELCELVAISMGYADNRYIRDLPEQWLEERPKSDRLYEFYNVLWIEWTGGIAYRRGVGRIVQSVWERQRLDRIELILG